MRRRTHVDRLVNVLARVVTSGRTAATLDRLAAGMLTADQREALVAEEAFGSVERLLQTAELAGHDPRRRVGIRRRGSRPASR